MRIIQEDPVYIRFEELTDHEIDDLSKSLSYKDLSAQYNYIKAKNNKWAFRSNPEWPQYVNSLKSKIIQNAFLEDKNGFYTYAGLLDFLQRTGYNFSFENKVDYPKFKSLAYDLRYKPFDPYKHQKEAVIALTSQKQVAVRLPTGSGKSFIAECIVKKMGLPTLIMVPSINIADQFIKQMTAAFGKKNVGLYGDGKKEYKKHIVIGIAASLAKLEPDSDAFKAISKKSLFIVDESHLTAAETLKKVALELTRHIPYRYSVSATPERTDGKDMLLEGLIGPVVYEKSFKELVKEGVVADLEFYIFEAETDSSYSGSNAKKNSQESFLYNDQILKMAARLANLKVDKLDEPTMILIEEKEQLAYLRPYLTVPFEFAHAQSDTTKQVDDFNKGKTKLLIGTTAISTGTDTKVVKNLILLFSGKSVIKFKQAIGRGTRIMPDKKFCNIFDFHVTNHEQSSRHFGQRLEIYQSMSDKVYLRKAFA